MAKFLNYEDRLEIESGLKEHMTFTELGEKLGRDRTTITKEIRNYSIEQDTGYGSYPHNTCKYRKACKRKKVCVFFASTNYLKMQRHFPKVAAGNSSKLHKLPEAC